MPWSDWGTNGATDRVPAGRVRPSVNVCAMCTSVRIAYRTDYFCSRHHLRAPFHPDNVRREHKRPGTSCGCTSFISLQDSSIGVDVNGCLTNVCVSVRERFS